jgi:hypothetical protein
MELNSNKVYQYKYLGLLFDPALTLDKHAEVLCGKLAQRIGVLRRVRSYLDLRVATMMYNALILPVFDYCNIVVGKGSSSNLGRLQRLQNRGGRVLLQWNRYTHSIDILNALKWLSVEERVKLNTAVMMYKCEKKECPKYLYDSIQYNIARNSCNTRGSSVQKTVPSAYKLVCGQKSFTYQGPKLVLALNFNVSDCQSVNVSKSRMTQFLVTARM